MRAARTCSTAANHEVVPACNVQDRGGVSRAGYSVGDCSLAKFVALSELFRPARVLEGECTRIGNGVRHEFRKEREGESALWSGG